MNIIEKEVNPLEHMEVSSVTLGEKMIIEANTHLPRQGFRQLNTNKLLILKEYELSKIINENRPVKVAHGNTGEAAFRDWLIKFLPKKYGVTSGYVISPAFDYLKKTPHYDVIIYDQNNSPILWEDINTDQNKQGLSKAIPVEFVLAVFEIKSSWNRKAVNEGIQKLEELIKFKKVSEDQIFPSLKDNFLCGLVFFELSKSNSRSSININGLLPSEELLNLGYMGGIVLKGEGVPLEESGLIVPIYGVEKNKKCNVGKGEKSLLDDVSYSDSKQYEKEIICLATVWDEGAFAEFLWSIILFLDTDQNTTLGLYGLSSFLFERRINLLKKE